MSLAWTSRFPSRCAAKGASNGWGVKGQGLVQAAFAAIGFTVPAILVSRTSAFFS